MAIVWVCQLGAATAGPVASYDMNVRITPDKSALTCDGTVSFELAPYSTDSIEILLNKVMHGLTLQIVKPAAIAGKANIRVEEHENGQTSYFVHFPSRRPEGETLTLRFQYHAGEFVGRQYYFDSTFFFGGGVATAWYPQPIEVIGASEGQLMDGRGTVRVTLPHPYVAVMAGAKNELRTKNHTNICTFSIVEPSVFTLFAGEYHSSTQSDKTTVSAYFLAEHHDINEYLRGCLDILSFLSGEFGAYPYADFSLIEFPTYVSEKLGIGGGSVVGGIMMPTNSLDNKFNLALFGHELAHQWWGNLVRNSGARGNGMLDEAMAQYGSLLVVEQLDGSVGAEAYRRKGYPGYIPSQSGFGYLRVAASGKDEQLSHLSAPSIHVIDDSKGFLVYNVLRNTLSKDTMKDILRNIVARHARGYITWQEFLDETAAGAKLDLRWFYDQWFDRTGAPEWQFTWRQDGDTLRVRVSQVGAVYRLSLEMELKGRAGQLLIDRIEVTDSVQEFAIKVSFPVSSVTLDPHYQVPHWEEDYKEEAFALVTPTRMTELRLSGKLAEAKALYEQSIPNFPEPDKYGVRFLMEYEIGRVLMIEGNPKEALPHFLEAVRAPSRRDELLAWAYLRVAQMAALVHDTETQVWGANAAISADAMLGGNTGAREIAQALLTQE